MGEYAMSPAEEIELLNLVSQAKVALGDVEGAMAALEEAIEIVETRRASLVRDEYKQSFVRIANAAPYQQKLREMMADLAGAGADISHPLLESRPVKRTLVLLLTSNRGLCGSYNTHLISAARARLDER